MSKDSELWQVFNPDGSPIQGKGLPPVEFIHGKNICSASHVWIWRFNTDSNRKEILLQRRSDRKINWPDRLDISAAGHINFGEDRIQAAIRETREEIHLSIDEEKLQEIFHYRKYASTKHGMSDVLDSINWVFSYYLNEYTDFEFNDGEVDSVQWVQLDTFKDMVTDAENNNLVPHGDDYFNALIQHIESCHK